MRDWRRPKRSRPRYSAISPRWKKQIEQLVDHIVDSDSATAAAAYERHIAMLEKEKLLATERLVKGVGPTPKIWSRVRDRSGLVELRLHDLRHSFASLGLAQGSALSILGSLLGHRHSGTTQRYAHLSEDPVRAASEKIGAEISLAIDTPSA